MRWKEMTLTGWGGTTEALAEVARPERARDLVSDAESIAPLRAEIEPLAPPGIKRGSGEPRSTLAHDPHQRRGDVIS